MSSVASGMGGLVPGRRLRQRAETAEARLDRIEDDRVALGEALEALRAEVGALRTELGELRERVERGEQRAERDGERAELVIEEVLRRTESADARLVTDLQRIDDRLRRLEGPTRTPEA